MRAVREQPPPPPPIPPSAARAYHQFGIYIEKTILCITYVNRYSYRDISTERERVRPCERRVSNTMQRHREPAAQIHTARSTKWLNALPDYGGRSGGGRGGGRWLVERKPGSSQIQRHPEELALLRFRHTQFSPPFSQSIILYIYIYMYNVGLISLWIIGEFYSCLASPKPGRPSSVCLSK